RTPAGKGSRATAPSRSCHGAVAYHRGRHGTDDAPDAREALTTARAASSAAVGAHTAVAAHGAGRACEALGASGDADHAGRRARRSRGGRNRLPAPEQRATEHDTPAVAAGLARRGDLQPGPDGVQPADAPTSRAFDGNKQYTEKNLQCTEPVFVGNRHRFIIH